MNTITFPLRLLLIAVVLSLAASASVRAADPPRPPNIVLIFTDDQGYGDLGCYGAKGFTTPNIDRIAQEGVRFTDFYVAQPVCSASRAALLTGCYANRIGISGALSPQSRVGLSSKEMTIADVVKTKGYATAAVGKWHLGHLPLFLPTRHGFDSYLGLPYSNDMWPHRANAKPGYPPLQLLDGDKPVIADVTAKDQATLTTRYTERAVQFINENKDRPFFLYVAHSMPHTPLFVSDKFKGKSAAGLYGDVIEEIDWSVGEILKALDTHKLAENTLIMFTCDNGPWLPYGNHGGNAGPLREGKGTVWEGGVREPFVARWPGKIPAGTVCHEPAMTIDILPTIAKITGADLPKNRIDGKDIGPLLRSEPGAKSPHEVFYFYYRTNELQALRSGKWKLILPHTYNSMKGRTPGKDGTSGGYNVVKTTAPQLYDLNADIGETKDVAAEHPDVVKKLLGYAEQAREDLGDALTKRKGQNNREPGRVPEPKPKPKPKPKK